MEIRRAQPAEAASLSKIAWAAKASWRYPEPWLQQWREQLTITPEFISANETFIALIDNRPVAFHALLQTPAALRLEHLWVRPEEMRRGIGKKLFAHACEHALVLRASSLTIEADPNAEDFYRRMGAIKFDQVETFVAGRRRVLPLLSYKLRNPDKAELESAPD